MSKKEVIEQPNQLEILFPTGKEITIRELVYIIKPFKLGQIPKVLKSINPIINLFGQLVGQERNKLEVITGILTNGGENILELIGLATNQPMEWVNDLELDEGIELLTGILEVNSDFFIKRVLPILTNGVATLNGQMQ